MKLTEENYYSTEANMHYVSVSQYKSFCGTTGKMGCESAALAEAKGEYVRPVTEALLVGQYVDSFFSGTLDEFKAEHPEMISSRGSTAGQLKVPFQMAEAMIERATRDSLFMRYMSGDAQVIMQGQIEGVDCKIKIDSCDGMRISDLKTVKDINETFYAKDLGERLNFISWWGYDLQAAFYREIYRQNTGDTLPFYICAISKNKTDGICYPRIKVIEIPPMIMDEKLAEIKSNITKIADLKNGLYEPIECGVCDYCSMTEVLEAPISSDMLLGEI